jgi:outer membrane immunogenic protein
MRLWKSAALASALAAFALPAYAADFAPSSPTVPSWTGPYLGLLAGASFGSVDSAEEAIPGLAPELNVSFGETDANIGIYAGYNWQFHPRYVMGVEAEASWVHADLGNPFDGVPEDAVNIDTVAALSARLGVLVTPETLLYVKGGVAFIDGEANIGFAADPVDDLLVGAHVGLGVESMLTHFFAVRAELAYTFVEEGYEVDFTSYEPSFLQARIGGAFKFGTQQIEAPAAPAIETDWTGFHLGGHLEGQGANTGYDEILLNGEQFADLRVGGGGQIGFDYAFQRLVVGVEASGTWTDLAFEDEGLGDAEVFAEVDAIYAVTGRLGFLVTPASLIYAKGGAAWIRTTVTDDAAAVFGTEGDEDTLQGYQVGGGIETLVGNNVSLRVEGLYTKATDEITFDGAQPDDFAVQPEIFSARLGASYRF